MHVSLEMIHGLDKAPGFTVLGTHARTHQARCFPSFYRDGAEALARQLCQLLSEEFSRRGSTLHRHFPGVTTIADPLRQSRHSEFWVGADQMDALLRGTLA
jgi:hypothetical protein